MTRLTKDASISDIRFAEGEEGTFSGYASIFGETDSFGDVVAAGAFKRTLAKRDGPVAMFWAHRSDMPVGVWTSLAEDQRGLKASGKLVLDATGGRDALALMKAGAVSGLSIGFNIRSADRGPNGGRVLTDIDLAEISLVALPSASKARVLDVKDAAGGTGLEPFLEACRCLALTMEK